MYKINTHTIKKSLKPLMMISVIATLLMATMSTWGTTGTRNANAIDLSKFQDFQGIDDIGQSAECIIVLVGCDGTGSVASSGDVNVGTGDDSTNGGSGPAPDCDTGIACFVDRLNPTQLGNLKFVLGLPVDASNQLLCDLLDDVSELELRAAITAPVVGVTDAVATAIINCLLDAGFTLDA